MGGSMSGMMPILVIIAIAAIGIPIYLKIKKNKTANSAISKRRSKDEVWKAIKQFLKDTSDYGKEIVDSYVVKRPHENFINPKLTSKEKKIKRIEIAKRKKELNLKKKEAKAKGINPKTLEPKVKDLYVVCFTTKQSKTGVLDSPRAIECEVVNKKISKKEWDRTILINGEVDYEKEMIWIKPIKEAEAIKNAKAMKLAQKIEEKKKKKLAKKIAKANLKAKK